MDDEMTLGQEMREEAMMSECLREVYAVRVPRSHATVGAILPQTCSEGHPFCIRMNKQTQELFAGCSHFPLCRESQDIILTHDPVSVAS